MKKFAVCGNIASGKTTVQKFLESKNYKVLDTDSVAHELLTVKNSKLYEKFKNYDVFFDGEFSREKMGQLIFSDSVLRIELEKVMHPQIREKISEFFVENSNEDFLFVGIPLLFEANMQDLFDKIIFIYTDDELRLQRLIKRNNYTKEHAIARIDSQINQDEKVRLSDYIIYNNGDISDLEKSVESLLKRLKQE